MPDIKLPTSTDQTTESPSDNGKNIIKKKVPKIHFDLPPQNQNQHQSLNNARANKQITRNDNMLFPGFDSPQVIRSLNSPSPSSVGNREKVRLAPHHSALDWEKFKHENNVKMIDPSSFPLRITKGELSKHTHPKDCWVALGGKIYNISSYLDFHPGGVNILVKFAGKDCTSIFMKYHRWVNFERILDECFIGFLV